MASQLTAVFPLWSLLLKRTPLRVLQYKCEVSLLKLLFYDSFWEFYVILLVIVEEGGWASPVITWRRMFLEHNQQWKLFLLAQLASPINAYQAFCKYTCNYAYMKLRHDRSLQSMTIRCLLVRSIQPSHPGVLASIFAIFCTARNAKGIRMTKNRE